QTRRLRATLDDRQVVKVAGLGDRLLTGRVRVRGLNTPGATVARLREVTPDDSGQLPPTVTLGPVVCFVHHGERGPRALLRGGRRRDWDETASARRIDPRQTDVQAVFVNGWGVLQHRQNDRHGVLCLRLRDAGQVDPG